MTACKRTLLILLLLITLIFTGYQVYLVLQPLLTADADRQYACLVNQHHILKMQRLLLEEKCILQQTQSKYATLTHQLALTAHPHRAHALPAQEPIALSAAESKTFEQLEAYVNNNKSTQPPALTEDEKFILGSPADRFTLQLMGVRDMNELTRFVKENQLNGAYIIHTYYLNKDWYVLVSGSYENHTEALKAIDTLAQNIKDLKPWIRQISSLQRAIQLYRN